MASLQPSNKPPLTLTSILSPTQALKFGRVQGMPDGSDYVIYGAASLRTGAKNASGENISVGCLLKLEMNVQANALRLTVRTLHPAATAALMDTGKALFA